MIMVFSTNCGIEPAKNDAISVLCIFRLLDDHAIRYNVIFFYSSFDDMRASLSFLFSRHSDTCIYTRSRSCHITSAEIQVPFASSSSFHFPFLLSIRCESAPRRDGERDVRCRCHNLEHGYGCRCNGVEILKEVDGMK